MKKKLIENPFLLMFVSTVLSALVALITIFIQQRMNNTDKSISDAATKEWTTSQIKIVETRVNEHERRLGIIETDYKQLFEDIKSDNSDIKNKLDFLINKKAINNKTTETRYSESLNNYNFKYDGLDSFKFCVQVNTKQYCLRYDRPTNYTNF